MRISEPKWNCMFVLACANMLKNDVFGELLYTISLDVK